MINFIPSVIENLFFFFIFLISVFLAFYIPGSFFLNNIIKSHFEKAVLSISVGIALWGLQGFIFGFLNLRFLTYFYLLSLFIIWYRKTRKEKLNISTSKFRFPVSLTNNIIILFFVFGIFGQVQQFFPSGFKFDGGFYIFSASNDDAFLHTSYINQLVKNFPPNEPGMTGVMIKNYHFLSNLVIADLIRIFKLPLLATQFQFMYLLISFLLGGSAYVLGKTLKLNKWGLIFIVYFQYFLSDIIYVLTFLTRGVFDFTIHPLFDGTMLLENPPRAFSFVILLTLFTLLVFWFKTSDKKLGVAIALLTGSLIGFKVHTGIPVLIGMGVIFLALLFQKKWKALFVPILSVTVSLILYLPVNAQAGGLLFAPFEMSRMFAVQEKLSISHLELARRIYLEHNNILQVLRMDLTMLIYFLVFQFGISLIGLLPLGIKFYRNYIELVFFLVSISISSLAIGTFFIQPVAFADIFNFYLVFNFVLVIFAVITLQQILTTKFKSIKLVLIIIIALLTIPRYLHKTSSVKAFFNPKPIISKEEMFAMKFIKYQTKKEDVVLVLNKGNLDSFYPYVSIFTDREMFLSGQTMLDRHGITYSDRQKVMDKILKVENNNDLYKLLVENNIDILYMYKNSSTPKVIPDQLRMIFENNIVIVYKVIK